MIDLGEIYRRINILSIYFFVGVCVLLPGDFLNIKKIFFTILIGINIVAIYRGVKRVDKKFFYIFIFPMILIIHSILLGNKVGDAIQYTSFFFMVSIVYIVEYYGIDYRKILMRWLSFLCALTCVMVILDLFNVFSINQWIILLANDDLIRNNFNIMGKDDSSLLSYKVFFKTSPLLVLLLFYLAEQKRYAYMLVVLLALMFSGTRANSIIPAFMLLLTFGFKDKLSIDKCLFLYGAVIVFFIALLLSWTEVGKYILYTDSASYSNAARGEHLKSLLSLFKENPSLMFTGMGMGSFFYTSAVGRMVQSIEWSYLDTFRNLGILLYLLFLLYLVDPFYKKISYFSKMSYATYLLIAGTNPLLCTSTAALCYILFWIDNKKVIKNN